MAMAVAASPAVPPLRTVKEAPSSESPTSVSKTPTMAPPAAPGTPQATNKKASSSSPTRNKPKSPPKTTNTAAHAASHAVLAYRQARSDFEDKGWPAPLDASVHAEEVAAAPTPTPTGTNTTTPTTPTTPTTTAGTGPNRNSTDGVEVKMFEEEDALGVVRTRSEVEVESFMFELESAIGLDVEWMAAAEKETAKRGEEVMEEEEDIEKMGDKDDMDKDKDEVEVEVEGSGTAPDNGETAAPTATGATEGSTKVPATCATDGCLGGVAAATAGAAVTCPGGAALPTSMAELEGLLAGACLGREEMAAEEEKELNEKNAIEIELLPPKVEGAGGTDAAAEAATVPLVRISTCEKPGPVDIDEVSHTFPVEWGWSELDTNGNKVEADEGKDTTTTSDSADSQTSGERKPRKVTIVDDPVDASSVTSSYTSPDPIPRRGKNKTDEESTVVSLTFKPRKNKSKKKQQMMAALGMTTAAGATAATAAAPAVPTTAVPTASPATNATQSPRKTRSSNKMFSSFKKALLSKKAVTIRMISVCADEETSSDLQNASSFALPNPHGKAGGACTSALLKALRDAEGSKGLTYSDVLTKMRADLQERGVGQIPQLTASESLAIRDPFLLNDGKGTARALLVGIHYVGEKNELSGCHGDVRNMHQYLTEVAGVDEDEIMVLMDDDECPLPSKMNIINAWKELVEDSEAGDSVFFHFSGHGGRIRDEGPSEESDGYDETICPVDYAEAGQIRDDDIYKILCEPMAKGVAVTVLMDSCHSGTVLDLPYTVKADEVGGKKFMPLKNTSKSAKYFGEIAIDGKKRVSAPSTPVRSSGVKSDVKRVPSTPSTETSIIDDDASKASC